MALEGFKSRLKLKSFYFAGLETINGISLLLQEIAGIFRNLRKVELRLRSEYYISPVYHMNDKLKLNVYSWY